MKTDYFKRVKSLNCWEHTSHCETFKGSITNRNFVVEHVNEIFFVKGVGVKDMTMIMGSEVGLFRKYDDITEQEVVDVYGLFQKEVKNLSVISQSGPTKS